MKTIYERYIEMVKENLKEMEEKYNAFGYTFSPKDFQIRLITNFEKDDQENVSEISWAKQKEILEISCENRSFALYFTKTDDNKLKSKLSFLVYVNVVNYPDIHSKLYVISKIIEDIEKEEIQSKKEFYDKIIKKWHNEFIKKL